MYGRTFTLRDSSQTNVGASHSGPGIAGVYTNEAGFLGYNEVSVQIGHFFSCNLIQTFRRSVKRNCLNIG